MDLLTTNKVLSSRSKVKILFFLYKCLNKHLNVNDLCCELKLSQPNLSRHLKELLAYEIVISHKQGKEKFYMLDKAWVNKFQDVIEVNFQRHQAHKGELCC